MAKLLTVNEVYNIEANLCVYNSEQNVKWIFLAECPSYEECICIEKRAFRIRSRDYEGNFIKQAGELTERI